jgi:hypothetical protein
MYPPGQDDSRVMLRLLIMPRGIGERGVWARAALQVVIKQIEARTASTDFLII